MQGYLDEIRQNRCFVFVLLLCFFFCEGLREKEHDALLRARRPPMTFTGLLIFRFPSRRNVSPFARSLAIDPVIYNGVFFFFFSLPTAFPWPLQPWLLFYKIDPLLWTYFFRPCCCYFLLVRNLCVE